MIATTDAKCAVLRQHGVLHPHPERVHDSLFQGHEFFDRRDLVQVKYEMLRRVRLEGHSATAASAVFGCSRLAFYDAKDAYQRGGLPSLIPRRPGPRHRHKLTEPILAFLLEQRRRDPAIAAAALRRMVHDALGVSVHSRSIERTLMRPQKRGRHLRSRSAPPNSGRPDTKIFASGC